MKKIKIIINTPKGLYLDKEVESILLKTTDGQRALLPRHVPIVLAVDIGRLEIKNDKNKEVYATTKGMCYFKDDVCNLFVDAIESPLEIDLDRALEAKKRAMQRLEQKQGQDLKRASIALERAINRINVKNFKF